MFYRLIGAIVLIPILCLMAAEREAGACGPEFSTSLLSNRPSTMLELPEGIFVVEASQLVPAPQSRYLVQEDSNWRPRTQGSVEERGLYERGARAFRKGDYSLADKHFSELLNLPAELRQHRSTWAAYMLGRVRSGAAAAAAYLMVRTLVAEGFKDALGLAASSLGQEARQHLRTGDLLRAVQLYAEQASHGHSVGSVSLLLLAREAAEQATSSPLMHDPIGQRLMAAYLYTRRHELTNEQAHRILQQLAEADNLAGASRLAAVAYQQGQWEQAERLAKHDRNTALSRWVLAKLALRRGDNETAEEQLRLARQAQLAAPKACDRGALSRVPGELAILALAEGRMMAAMKHAWQSRDLHDGALYIAERVLTLDELSVFLETPPIDAVESADLYGYEWRDVTIESLRDLLGRRLMRAGLRELAAKDPALATRHFSEALSYLSEENRVVALVLATSLQEADAAADPIDQARALYRASRLARRYGMETLGTSHAPDWAVTGGGLNLSDWLVTETPGLWIREYERQRVKASAPASSQRFHYRWLASRLAEGSADLLPRQSQAFAATLCHSARFIFNRDQSRLKELWSRYVREGPAVDFASQFGQVCPEPDFLGARRYVVKTQPQRPWPIFAALLACLLGLALVIRRVRRPPACRGRIGGLVDSIEPEDRV